MNTTELLSMLNSVQCMNNYQKYIISSNEILNIKVTNKPIFLIINNDPSFLPGSHWSLCFINKR